MIRPHQLIPCLAVAMMAQAASAQPQFPPRTNTTAPAAGTANVAAYVPGAVPMPPLPPVPVSPVTFFRKLLAMTAMERNNSLTNRPPAVRARILAKVHEYLTLPPDERELRLESTDLRWYLTPLLGLAPANRQTRLDQIPADMRELVQSRLAQWDVLPPNLQQEFLANDRTLPYFAHVETTNSAGTSPEQQRIAAQFSQFFDLIPGEKRKALNTLSDADRAKMEKTLQSFNQLSPHQRQLCVKNYARFAGMSAAERADFLKNAERWSQLSPAERRTWQDLVANVPLWPPMPPMTVPPNLIPPHVPLKPVRPGLATNMVTN